MSHKIVVIEDSVEVCESIASILKLGRYTVFTANNGRQGIEAVQTHHPDLILCDIMMPELDGYGVLHILSKDPATCNIPFIFLTAKAEQKDFRQGMNFGADDYITKPFDGLELLKVIELRLKKNDLIKTTFHNNIADIDDFFNKAKQLPDFKKLSENRRSRIYKKKEFIFIEGQQPNYLYLIAKGLVKTYKSNNEGKELITGLHGEGKFIGFVPLLESKPNNESAIVVKEAEIYLIPHQDFLTMIYTNKEIAKKFISMLSSNLYEAENTMFDLAYQSVRQRVATVLIKQLEVDSKNAEAAPVVLVPRKDLSKMVGTSTESLNRTLADFKDEGLIEIQDKGLKIIQRSKLERARK
ncbi:MAG TPA: response regulator [Cyclobacteriaceae bacterium]|nr:response regulator [Cyclobacteriaceae bacterium]